MMAPVSKVPDPHLESPGYRSKAQAMAGIAAGRSIPSKIAALGGMESKDFFMVGRSPLNDARAGAISFFRAEAKVLNDSAGRLKLMSTDTCNGTGETISPDNYLFIPKSVLGTRFPR